MHGRGNWQQHAPIPVNGGCVGIHLLGALGSPLTSRYPDHPTNLLVGIEPARHRHGYLQTICNCIDTPKGCRYVRRHVAGRTGPAHREMG